MQNDYKRYLSEFGPTAPSQKEATQIWTEKVAGGKQKGRVYGMGSRNELGRIRSGLEGIGSSRQAEAIDSVQLAAMSQQIAQLTHALTQSVAQNDITCKTVEELKKQMASVARLRRHRSPSPDSSSEEDTESDEELVGATP